jgi:transketolase
MRKAFFEALYKRALIDKRITIVNCDMGYSLLEKWRDTLPGQYINCGIAEQNGIMIAAGMASRGKKPYVYSISPFVSYRCLEQIRIDCCYNNTDVKIVGTGQGLDYGVSGTTHHATEDIAVMRALPNIDVANPADKFEAESIARASTHLDTPMYIRLGRGGEPVIYPKRIELRRGEARKVVKSINPKLMVLSTGAITSNVIEACNKLRHVEAYSCPWLKPFNDQIVRTAGYLGVPILTVEEHNRIGGLRSIVLESMNDSQMNLEVHSMALPDEFQKCTGNQISLRWMNELDAKSIRNMITNLTRG